MTKTVSTSKKPRKQHSPEFRSEALKLAERIGVAAAARELSLYESQLYGTRTARAVLTGMCYSAGSAMRHGSSSLTRLTGQSAMTLRIFMKGDHSITPCVSIVVA